MQIAKTCPHCYGVLPEMPTETRQLSASPVRFIFIVAVPRTGSSHLTRLLRNCEPLRVKAELFHPRSIDLPVEDILALAARAGGRITDDESLCAWRRDHPRETLESLFEAGGGRIVVAKIFPFHLSQEQLADAIFKHRDTVYLVLQRRPIESYISGLKANSIGGFGRIDTTSTKPTLAPEDFGKWAMRIRRWYEWLDEELRSRSLPHAPISYEAELDGVSNRDALSGVLRKLEAMGLPHLDVPQKLLGGQRQDRERDYRSRVANWQAFEKAVRGDPDGASLLDWAEAAP